MKAFPLATLCGVCIRGIETTCLARTEESKHEYRDWWKGDVVEWGWCADGDYAICQMAERFSLPRDLVKDRSYDADAPDVLHNMIPMRVRGYEVDDPQFEDHHYHPWGNKTQGRLYHMYLLAIGCLIAARLGPKAYVFGDITMGQCQHAVDLANEHLAEPVELPDWCDLDRLFARVVRLPLTEVEKIEFFDNCYLGRHDPAFGAFLREHFSVEATDTYLDRNLQESGFGTWGFKDELKRYLRWGFDLDRLCSLVRFEDGESEEPYADFVTMVMDTKLHHPEKERVVVPYIDWDDDEPCDLGTLLTRIDLMHAKDRELDRYVPIEEIRSALKAGIGERCPVDEIIDAYLKQEAASGAAHLGGETSTEVLENAAKAEAAQALNAKRQAESYDIALTSHLPLYEAGNTIRPAIEKRVCDYLEFYRGLTSEDTYRSLMEAEPRRRCQWLAGKSEYILLRDCDWKRIFDDIMALPQSFARYYSMGRVAVTSDAIKYIVRAFVANDDLWSHAA